MVLGLAYRAGVPWNETAYDNPDFDAALNDAEATLDVNERKKKMAVCEKILQDDAIIPQPFWRSVFKASNKRGEGFLHPSDPVPPVPFGLAGRLVQFRRRGGRPRGAGNVPTGAPCHGRE